MVVVGTYHIPPIARAALGGSCPLGKLGCWTGCCEDPQNSFYVGFPSTLRGRYFLMVDTRPRQSLIEQSPSLCLSGTPQLAQCGSRSKYS